MGAEQNLAIWKTPDTTLRKLRSITRHREDFVTDKTIINNRLEALENSHDASPLLLKQLKTQLSLLDKQIEEINHPIKDTVEENVACIEIMRFTLNRDRRGTPPTRDGFYPNIAQVR